MCKLNKSIPCSLHFSLADFGMDFTDVMKRKGGVYPWFRSAGLGYFYGADITDPANEDWKGVCNQVRTQPSLTQVQNWFLP